MNVEIYHIGKIIEQQANGCTVPLKAMTDDGRSVFLKTFNNCEGNRVLFNEWVSYNLAKLFDLPIPEAFWGIIDDKTVLQIPLDDKCKGICFCSTVVTPAARLLPNIISSVENINVFGSLLLFDHWIYNADRNPGNILFNFKDKKMYIIDHSHVFSDTADWTERDLELIRSGSISSDNTILRENSEVYSWFFNAKSRDRYDIETVAKEKFPLFKSELIHDIIHDTPENILPPQNMCNALEEFLVSRSLRFEEICNAIMNSGNGR